MWNLEKLVKDVAEELDTSKDMVVQKLQKMNQDLKEKDKKLSTLLNGCTLLKEKNSLPSRGDKRH